MRAKCERNEMETETNRELSAIESGQPNESSLALALILAAVRSLALLLRRRATMLAARD